MKKILLTTMIAGALAASAFAQGTVGFTASSRIWFTTNGVDLVKMPTGANPIPGMTGINVAMYLAANGTASPFTATTAGLLSGAWTESDNVLHGVVAAGTYVSTFTFSGLAGGGAYECLLVGWTGTATDWNTAYQAGGQAYAWAGSTLGGGSTAWSQGTGAPNGSPPTPPTAVVTGAGGFNNLVFSTVPEPSTLVLAGLGAAALAIFRRRK